MFYFAFLSKGKFIYREREVICYGRPLNSSTDKVYSGIANTEGATLPKIMNMESVVCPFSESRVGLHPASNVAFCGPPLASASLYLQVIQSPSSGEAV